MTVTVAADDDTAPQLTITRGAGQPDPVRADTVVFRVSADEPVTDLAAGDVTVLGTTGAQTVAINRVDGRTFDVSVTGMRRSGSVKVRLAAGAVEDLAGNPSAEKVSPAISWVSRHAPSLETVFEQRCLSDGGVVAIRLAPDNGSRVSIRSNNAGLLPQSRMSLARSGNRLSLVVRPRPGVSGVARVTVTATNAAGSDELVVSVFVGTARGDVMQGSAGPDVLLGRGGGDALAGGDGMDLLCGGQGADRLRGGKGLDALYGEQGDDVLFRSFDQDRLDGGAGRDRVVWDPAS